MEVKFVKACRCEKNQGSTRKEYDVERTKILEIPRNITSLTTFFSLSKRSILRNIVIASTVYVCACVRNSFLSCNDLKVADLGVRRVIIFNNDVREDEEEIMNRYFSL